MKKEPLYSFASDMRVVDAERGWTVRRLKEAMCALIRQSPNEFRIRRTDFWSQPEKLIDDGNSFLLSSS